MVLFFIQPQSLPVLSISPTLPFHWAGICTVLYVDMFGPTPMEKVYYCDKTRLMAQNKGPGPLWVTSSLTNGLNLSEIEPISAPNSIQRDVDDSLQKEISRSIHVQLSAGYKISNSMSNFQLSTSCQPLSPLSSHQRPTLAFCPRANGWKLLEMLEHMPLDLQLSLYTTYNHKAVQATQNQMHIHCKSEPTIKYKNTMQRQ